MRGVGPGERPGHPTLVRVSASVRAGDRLGPYLIDGLIGRGGMGEVWEATDQVLGRIVADIIAATLVQGAAGTADDETLAALRGRVRALTDAFPLYPGLAQ